ncbi:MAG: hypothetical protein H6625_07350 [Bdellovibrionaceae bacterium]|nr:hypothetical protein [Pseudobdellovibrionaceae bacterium]
MNKQHIIKAYDYYTKFILNEEKLALLEKYNFRVNGSVPSQDWELFAAILTNLKSTEGYGADLPGYEVKSAKSRNSFEYQYHKNAGLEKLEEDMVVSHLFISYSPSYTEITVRLLKPEILKPTFESWREELENNYRDGSTRQRFRKSISFGTVESNGTIIMEIRAGKLITK